MADQVDVGKPLDKGSVLPRGSILTWAGRPSLPAVCVFLTVGLALLVYLAASLWNPRDRPVGRRPARRFAGDLDASGVARSGIGDRLLGLGPKDHDLGPILFASMKLEKGRFHVEGPRIHSGRSAGRDLADHPARIVTPPIDPIRSGSRATIAVRRQPATNRARDRWVFRFLRTPSPRSRGDERSALFRFESALHFASGRQEFSCKTSSLS